jgi:hypothetical protein
MPLPGRHTQGVTTSVTTARRTRNPTRSAAATTTLGVLLALLSVPVSALALAAPAQAAGTGHVRLPAQAKLAHACSVPSTISLRTTTRFRCFAERRTDIAPLPHGTTTSASFKAARAAAGFTAAVTPPGLHPADLTAAYSLPSSTRGVGQTVYIVDAYNYPNAESDLAVYRAQYGLPACTTANGCFRKLNQNGLTSPLPATDNGWAAEMALDLDMVSAVCPNCNITLIEANDASGNMMTAVGQANTLGAKFVSMSWGGVESKSAAAYDAAYFKPSGVVYTASSGDSGFNGALYPASSNRVVAVGGTSLSRSGNDRGWTESAWSGAGSGCSGVEDRPAWQAGNPGCSTRAFTDISAVADPSTGVSVYLTTGGSGWSVYGGTSASSPIIAAAFALAGPPSAGSQPGQTLYSHRSRLNDVTTGSNGSCSPSVLCHATTGWDGPTGLGTPNGIGAFSTSRGTHPAGVMGRYFATRPAPVVVTNVVPAGR